MNANSRPKLCGLIGYPVKHSLSPGMHKIAFNKLGLSNWDYILIEAENPDRFNEVVKDIVRHDFAGFNVTIPYKQEIMKYLTHISSDAKSIGAVNTVVNKNGKLYGYNTDSYGFMIDLKESLDFKGESAIVLGAGGAGRAVIWALMNCGLKKIFIYDKDIVKTNKVIDDFNIEISGSKNNIELIAISEKSLKYWDSPPALLVNATPIGMKEGPPPVHLKNLSVIAVYDVIYNRKTELLKDAEKLSLKTADGTGMLLYQGIKAFELWTGIKITEEVKEKMRKYIRTKENK